MRDFEPAIRCSCVGGYLKIPSLKIKSHRQLASIFSFMRFYDRERLVSVCFDKNKRIIGYEVVSIGGLNFSSVVPREVLKMPLLLRASYLALIHNHPSGDCSVSDDDMALTLRMALAAKIFNIKIIYSMVIGRDGYSLMRVRRKGKLKIPMVKTVSYSGSLVKNSSSKNRVGRYEIFIRENLWHSYKVVFRIRGFSSYKSIRRYLRDNIGCLKLDENSNNNGFMVMYVDDNWRPLYKGIYCFYRRKNIIKDMLLKGVLMNAARFVVGVKKFKNSSIMLDALSKVRKCSRLVGMPLEDLIVLS